MSGNELGAFGDEQKMLEYVYGDVDDSDIFATEALNNSFTESDPIAEADTQNPENEILKEKVEKLQKDKEILELRISELYKTARAELERKDSRLKELQNEKDNILFRRGNVRNKQFNVDMTVPVLQQVERDLTNQELQNFNARYRIPKRINPPNYASKPEQTSEDKELHKRLQDSHTQKEKCNRYVDYSAQPHGTDKPRSDDGKDHDKIKEYSDKNRKDSHISDRSRPRERLATQKPTHAGNLSNKYNVGYKQKYVPGRSKSKSKNASPESYAREEGEFLNKRNRTKSLNEDVKPDDKIMCSSSASMGRSRSPSNKDEDCKQKYVQGRSKSSSRYKNTSPESYSKKKPRSSSREEGELPNKRNRSKSVNEDVKPDDKIMCSSSASMGRSRSPSNKDEDCKQKYVQGRSKSSSRYKNASPESYSKREPRSSSREEGELPNKRNRSKSVNEDVKLEDKIMHSSSTSRGRSTSSSNKHRFSSKDHYMKKSVQGRSKSFSRYKNNFCENRVGPRTPSVERNEDSREKYMDFGDKKSKLKEKNERRSRSVSCDRDSRRVSNRSRSISRRRYLRYGARNGHRFQHDRSHSSSAERDEERQFTRKAKSPIRRDKVGRVINSKNNRNRSRSREGHSDLNVRLRNRDGRSRARNIGQLRERVLRCSVDRDGQDIRGYQGEDKNTYKGTHYMMTAPINNEADHSDLEEMRLHLSGESDQDMVNNENDQKKRNEISNELLQSNGNDFEGIKDVGFDIQQMSTDDLRRLVDKRKKIYNKLSNLSEDQNIDRVPDVRFCYPVGKLTNNDKFDMEQIEKNNDIFSQYDNNCEELDYEHSLHEFPSDFKKNQEGSSRLECRENQSKEVSNYTNIRRQKEESLTDRNEKKGKYENDVTWHTSNPVHAQEGQRVECSIRTVFELRQHQKSLKLNQGDVKSLNIIRNNPPVADSDVNSAKANPFGLKEEFLKRTYEKPTGNGRIPPETVETKILSRNCDINEKNKEQASVTEKIEDTSDMFQYIDNVKQVFKKTAQEFNTTRNKITNGIDVNIKHNSEVKGEVDYENRTKIVRNEEKEVDHVAKKRMEKISLMAYKSRTKSIDVKVQDVDSKGTVPYSSEKNQATANGPEKSSDKIESTPLQNEEILSVESTDLLIDELPAAGDGIQENDSNLENVKNSLFIHLKSNDEAFVLSNKQVTQKLSEQENKLPQNELNISLEKNIAGHDTVINESDDLGEASKREDDSYKDPNSFIHDLSISDDDVIQESTTLGKEENLTEDCNKKINVLSNITIQGPRYKDGVGDIIVTVGFSKCYTPPHRMKLENLEIDIELKKSEQPKRRKSLLKIVSSPEEEEVEKAVNIPGFRDDSNSGPCKNAAENNLHIRDNTAPQAVQIDSEIIKTPRSPPYGSSEYVDEIQEQVKSITGDTSPQYSSSYRLSAKTEHFDTEGLQKCLEEDIKKPEENCKAELKKNKVKVRNIRDGHEVKNIKRKREQKDKRGKTPSPIEKPIEFDNNKYVELFGPMTPSPGKVDEILEPNAIRGRDKAKRNIIECEENNYAYSSFKLRDKSEEANKNNLIKDGNENLGSKNMQSPEKIETFKPLLQTGDKKIEGLKRFCTNPTYIPNIRDTPKAVFESPNHYIHKKNAEMKEKIKRNLTEDALSNKFKTENATPGNISVGKHRLTEEKSQEQNDLSERSTEKQILIGELEESLLEEEYMTKTKRQKVKKIRKNKNSKDDFERKEDDKIVQKVKAKRGKKSLQNKSGEGNFVLPERKKTLKQSVSKEGKKPRSPSFKIKITTAKKRQKNNAKENVRNKRRRIVYSDDDSDSVQDETDQREEIVKKEVVSCNVADNKIKNRKGKVVEKCMRDSRSMLEDPPLRDSHQGENPRNLAEIEPKNIKLKEELVKPKKKGRPRKIIIAADHIEKNSRKEIINEQTCEETLAKGQEGCYQENVVIENSSQVREAVESDIKEYTKKNIKTWETNAIKVRQKSLSFGEASVKNIPGNDQKAEHMKTIKRITPTRIGDCTLSKGAEKFKDLKAKRELFLDHPGSVLDSNKRRRLSSDSDDCTAKKCPKVSYTESWTTVDKDVVDNGARTRIKVQEIRLNMEVPPNCSPLPRIEQTYDALSKNTALNKSYAFIDASNPQLQPTHEGVYPDIVLPVTDHTFPILNLDTKDLTMLGPLEKDIYENLSEFSLSGKSMLFANVIGGSRKSDKDSNDDNGVQRDNNVTQRDRLSFTNFLNNKNPNTSTPIKNIGPMKHTSENETNSGRDVKSNDNLHTTSSCISGISVTTVCSVSGNNANVSCNKTSSGMLSNVCSDSNGSKPHVKFSGALKRDRRRPISMKVLD